MVQVPHQLSLLQYNPRFRPPDSPPPPPETTPSPSETPLPDEKFQFEKRNKNHLCPFLFGERGDPPSLPEKESGNELEDTLLHHLRAQGSPVEPSEPSCRRRWIAESWQWPSQERAMSPRRARGEHGSGGGKRRNTRDEPRRGGGDRCGLISDRNRWKIGGF